MSRGKELSSESSALDKEILSEDFEALSDGHYARVMSFSQKKL